MLVDYGNQYAAEISQRIEDTGMEIESVFKSLSEKGLGEIFRDAVMQGSISAASMDALEPEIAAELKEIFNGASMTEMAPGVYMFGGPCITMSHQKRDALRAHRAKMLQQRFNRAGANGNRLAHALKEDLGKLAFLMEKMEILKKEQQFLIANTPVLKIA